MATLESTRCTASSLGQKQGAPARRTFHIQRTCVDKIPGLGDCPPEDLKIEEGFEHADFLTVEVEECSQLLKRLRAFKECFEEGLL